MVYLPYLHNVFSSICVLLFFVYVRNCEEDYILMHELFPKNRPTYRWKLFKVWGNSACGQLQINLNCIAPTLNTEIKQRTANVISLWQKDRLWDTWRRIPEGVLTLQFLFICRFTSHSRIFHPCSFCNISTNKGFMANGQNVDYPKPMNSLKIRYSLSCTGTSMRHKDMSQPLSMLQVYGLMTF